MITSSAWKPVWAPSAVVSTITCYICQVRHLLDQQSTAVLIHACLTSRLNSGNALLLGLPANLLQGIQEVQNAAAQLVSRTGRREHSHNTCAQRSPLAAYTQQRIGLKYEVLSLTNQAVHGIAPQYLCELLTRYQPGRSLRSSDAMLLTEPPPPPSLWSPMVTGPSLVQHLICGVRFPAACVNPEFVSLPT